MPGQKPHGELTPASQVQAQEGNEEPPHPVRAPRPRPCLGGPPPDSHLGGCRSQTPHFVWGLPSLRGPPPLSPLSWGGSPPDPQLGGCRPQTPPFVWGGGATTWHRFEIIAPTGRPGEVRLMQTLVFGGLRWCRHFEAPATSGAEVVIGSWVPPLGCTTEPLGASTSEEHSSGENRQIGPQNCNEYCCCVPVSSGLPMRCPDPLECFSDVEASGGSAVQTYVLL